MNEILRKSLKQAKRMIIGTIGFTVLLTGVAMVFLPGPAMLVVPIGLAILATEFVWARRLLKKAKSRLLNEASRKNNKNNTAKR